SRPGRAVSHCDRHAPELHATALASGRPRDAVAKAPRGSAFAESDPEPRREARRRSTPRRIRPKGSCRFARRESRRVVPLPPPPALRGVGGSYLLSSLLSNLQLLDLCSASAQASARPVLASLSPLPRVSTSAQPARPFSLWFSPDSSSSRRCR